MGLIDFHDYRGLQHFNRHRMDEIIMEHYVAIDILRFEEMENPLLAVFGRPAGHRDTAQQDVNMVTFCAFLTDDLLFFVMNDPSKSLNARMLLEQFVVVHEVYYFSGQWHVLPLNDYTYFHISAYKNKQILKTSDLLGFREEHDREVHCPVGEIPNPNI
jgi:hypothetical protein